ncbi:MAG TPA: alpha/beta fold hydrolase [Candidatus Angelobacter sp.]|nr:alpha/beta fold hydrolase [Candidatus Angelobacter sp.]
MQPSKPTTTADRSASPEFDAAAHPLGTAETTGVHNFFGEPFAPRRLFIGAHAQTLAGNFLPRGDELPTPEERLIRVDPEMQVLCHCHWQPERTAATTIIIVHGLEGSTESQYVIGTGNKAWSAGMNVVRMNMRNCGGTENLGPSLYNSSMSADVGTIAMTLVRDENLQRIVLAGFSMGGNLVLKMLGEWGADAPAEIVAGVGVSPAMDLAASADALHERANLIYEWKFMRGLKRRIERKAKLYPDRYDTRYLRGLRSLREFDDQITARYCGFSDAHDYYARAASSQFLDRIAVPTLILHSDDDPFIRILPETRRKIAENPHITYLETVHGGHCAFLAEANGYDGRWAERQAIAFAQRVERGESIAAPAWSRPANGR